jgi:uncharacterized protein (UPF0262 family)
LQRGSDAQRTEWETNVRALLADATCKLEEDATLQITVGEQQFSLSFEGADGGALGVIRVDYALLSELVTDYLDIVRQMSTAGSVNQMEALDMAKKVTHDKAGRVLKRQLRELGFDLDTSRRLFTLLLSLKVDTTRLPGVSAHRRVR